MVTLSHITKPSSEKVEPSEVPNAWYLSLEHIEPHTRRIIGRGKATDVQSTKTVFRAGDVLYGKLRPYLNKVTIADFDGVCSTDIFVFPQSERIDSRYLMHFLNSSAVVEYANHLSAGVQLPRISFDDLGELELPLPPLAEQKRIVEAIERLTARVDAARARLAAVPAILKRFRQAVLAAACSGRLTEDWRDGHPLDAPSESGDLSMASLLSRAIGVAAQRRGRLANLSRANPLEVDTDDFPPIGELPSGWVLTRVGVVAPLIQYGTSSRSDATESDGVPNIGMQNIKDGRLDFTELKYISRGSDNLDTYRVKVGDILFNRTNSPELVGKSAVFGEAIEAVFASYLIRVQVNAAIALPHFVCYWINSSWGRAWARHVKTDGVSQSNINGTKLAAMPLPLTTLPEQAEIVRRVESLTKLADAIERRIAAAQARADKLTQSILAKAFRGELVPTAAESEAANAQPVARAVVWRFEDFAAVQAEIVRRLPSDPTLGRKKLFKVSYLAAAFAGAKTEYPLKRDAAGPYDGKLQADAEAHAASEKWFTANNVTRNPSDAHYRTGAKANQATAASKTLLGDNWTKFEALLAAAKNWDSAAAELHATTHAAWNALLAEGSAATPEAIAARFFAWSDEKAKRFTKWNVEAACQALTKLGLVPTGRCLVVEGLGQHGLFSAPHS